MALLYTALTTVFIHFQCKIYLILADKGLPEQICPASESCVDASAVISAFHDCAKHVHAYITSYMHVLSMQKSCVRSTALRYALLI